MPILGTTSSPAKNFLVSPSFESIATQIVGAGGAASITFSSIPSTYKHLQLRYIGRATWQYGDSVVVRFNGDTTSSNYPYVHAVYANGTTAAAYNDNASPQPAIGYLMPGNGSYSTANMFATGILDILDYSSNNKNKVMRNLYGSDNNYTGSAGLPTALSSAVWLNTAAVSSVTVTAAYSNLAQYSHFALYGIKG
jgi:hypothetical protein